MATFQNITTAQLREVLALREQIEAAQAKLNSIRGDGPATKKKVTKGKRTMSAETIEKMRLAQQARWAKTKKGATV